MNGFYKSTIYGFTLFYPMKVFGKENIPKGGAVLVCNHFRAIDPAFIAKVYGKDISFLAKKELFKNAFMRKCLKSYGAISVDRESPDLKTMMSILKILKDGHKLMIFPEGTRNKSGTNELQPLKPGSAMFAAKAQCPIVPIMFYKKPRAFKKTYIIIGKPFELTEFYGKKLTQEDIAEMENVVSEKMKSEHKNLCAKFNAKGKLIKEKKIKRN